MARVLQLLLVICLTAVVFCTVDQLESADTLPASEVLDAGYYGMEDAERDAEVVEPSVREREIETDNAVVSADETTTRAEVGRHSPRRHHRRPHRHHGRGHHGRRPRGQWTAEEKLNHVCRALNSSTNSRRDRRMSLASLTPEKRATLLAVLEARKTEMNRCCLMSGTERTQCTEQMNNDRYDRVCNDEEALCVWSAAFQRDQVADTTPLKTVPRSREIRLLIPTTKERCCALEDAERYQCFATARSTVHRDRSRRIRSD